MVRKVGNSAISRLVNFIERPKRKDRTAIGAVLTNLISHCIALYGLEKQIVFGEHQPVDFVWQYLGFGWECKRFIDTKYVMKAWLQKEVIDRFSEQEQIIRKPIPYRALIVNEKRWDKHIDYWLMAQGIHVLEVGKLGSRLGNFEASLVFMAWFEDMVLKICKGR
jgi:hypothetical protein